MGGRSKMVRRRYDVLLHKRGHGCCIVPLIVIAILFSLLCSCCVWFLFWGDWEFHSYPAEEYSLYNFAFGCAFDKTIFVSYSVVNEKEMEALQYCKTHSALWKRIASFWSQNAMKRTVVDKFSKGKTWPQEPPNEPIYILWCPSFGVVIGQDPQTYRVNFAITFEGLRFSELTEWSYPRIQSWEAIQVRVWEPGVPWTELPTDFPKLQQCFMGR